MVNGFHFSHTSDLMLERKLQKAREVLGLEDGIIDKAHIMAAFRFTVKACHPDNTEDAMKAVLNGHIPAQQQYTLQAMRDAKDLLLKHLENENG